MKTFSFYHKDTGVFADLQISSTDDAGIEVNTPLDHVAIEGRYHPLSHRMEIPTNTIIRSDAPSTAHEWSDSMGRWICQENGGIEGTAEEERRLVRRLILNPGDASARARLAQIDSILTDSSEDHSRN